MIFWHIVSGCLINIAEVKRIAKEQGQKTYIYFFYFTSHPIKTCKFVKITLFSTHSYIFNFLEREERVFFSYDKNTKCTQWHDKQEKIHIKKDTQQNSMVLQPAGDTDRPQPAVFNTGRRGQKLFLYDFLSFSKKEKKYIKKYCSMWPNKNMYIRKDHTLFYPQLYFQLSGWRKKG